MNHARRPPCLASLPESSAPGTGPSALCQSETAGKPRLQAMVRGCYLRQKGMRPKDKNPRYHGLQSTRIRGTC